MSDEYFEDSCFVMRGIAEYALIETFNERGLRFLAIKNVDKKVFLRGGICSCTVFYHQLYGVEGFLWNDRLVSIFDNHDIFFT